MFEPTGPPSIAGLKGPDRKLDQLFGVPPTKGAGEASAATGGSNDWELLPGASEGWRKDCSKGFGSSRKRLGWWEEK